MRPYSRTTGNVRELRKALERAVILSEGGQIYPEHLAPKSRSKASGGQATTNLGIIERDTIERVLCETEWNKSNAARRLGLSRTQLYGRLRKYGLETPPGSSGPLQG